MLVHRWRVLRHCGLDFYGVDACFTKHHIVNGMQLHLLCGRTGANTVVIMAWSLELSETSDTYNWFANQCDEAGFGDLVRIASGRMNRNPVVFSDGFKGTDHFADLFPRLHHALCGLHLSKAIRHCLRRMRATGQPVHVGFADNQVIAVCTAKTDADFTTSLAKLKSTSPSAAGRLMSYPRDKWATSQMAKNFIPCFGHCTSNVVEGTNGVLEPARHEHPYRFLDTIVRYVSERMAKLDAKFNDLHDNGKLLTEFASAIFKRSRQLAQRRAYTVQAQANNKFVVTDPQSKHKVGVWCGVCVYLSSVCAWLTFATNEPAGALACCWKRATS